MTGLGRREWYGHYSPLINVTVRGRCILALLDNSIIRVRNCAAVCVCAAPLFLSCGMCKGCEVLSFATMALVCARPVSTSTASVNVDYAASCQLSCAFALHVPRCSVSLQRVLMVAFDVAEGSCRSFFVSPRHV